MKALGSLVVMICAAIIVGRFGIYVFTLMPQFVFAGDLTAVKVTALYVQGETYYAVPEKALESGTAFTADSGKRYYVISEENLRLLGPEFLAMLSKEGN